MCRGKLIVLKFGGSVLTDETTIRLAVHEIYRWRRRGNRVVAVVSALAGVTDELYERCRRIAGRPSPETVAAVVSNGEIESAMLLSLQLDRAGVPGAVLVPGAIGLVAEGPPLDATPVDLNETPLRQALEREGVVVVPGFIAQEADGRPCVLGRGGSDLTALYLAHRLGADVCRLVKDVDGLYERDPSQPGPRPRRYVTASWDDALGTDGSIVQHKAVRFAKTHGIEFELGRFNGRRPTRIGRGPAVFCKTGEPHRRLRVALLGRGAVGGGVYELLCQLQPLAEIVQVAVRTPDRHLSDGVLSELLTTDPVEAAAGGADLVIELIGGTDAAGRAVTTALRSGSHVVTANKAILAEQGDRLRDLARTHGRMLRYSAAVGGSMPLLEHFSKNGHRRVRSIRAVLNGTTNYVIDRAVKGHRFAEAVREAQQLGFAEADPTRDLSGQDAADKLAVVADAIDATRLSVDQIRLEPLGEETIRAALALRVNGEAFRHVASLDDLDGAPSASVRLCRLDRGDPLSAAEAEHNAAVIEWSDGQQEILRGKGAGRWPTAEAVIADVLEIIRNETA